MNPPSRLATSRRLAVHAMARATPLVASGLVHVLVVSAALAFGFRAAPRWQPAAQAELIVLARDVLPAETPSTPRLETQRPPVSARPSPVVPPLSPPRVSPSTTPAKVVDTPLPKPEIPPRVEEALPTPPKREEAKVDAAPPPPAKPDAPPTTVLRVDDAKPPAGPEAPPPRPAVAESRGPQAETGRSGGSLFGAPAPSGEERPGTGRAGSAPSSSGPPPATAGGGGAGVAALPGPAAGRSGTGITRSAIPRGGYQVQPAYPASARQLGIQGTSLLRVHVAADGHVTDVVVTKSAGHAEMDQAAVAAVRQWRFEPGRKGEEPVGMWVVLPVEFRIK